MLEFDRKKCCGCTACASVCPLNCIKMVEDVEGFQIPKYTSKKSECVNCELCEKVCPLLNSPKDKKHFEKGYIVQNTDEKIRSQSTSGGAFTAIAEIVIENGGVVFGATYDKNYQITHIGVNDKNKLWKFRNSKYVQSNIKGLFPKIKKMLDTGILVCFSGTPCQIEGLKSYLRKQYDNLITVDVVCHGISSPLIWRKYLELQKDKKPDWIYFRDKHYGYKYSTMTFVKKNKKIYYEGVETDPMLRAFFTNNCDRESCYECSFKKRYRISDITIWDCYQPQFFYKAFGDDKGTTSMLVNSEIGQKLAAEIFQSGKLRYYEVDPDELTFGNNEMINSVKRGSMRSFLLRDARNMDSIHFFEKYFPVSTKAKIKKFIRILLLKLGVYNKIKYALFLYRRKNSKHGVK